MTKKIVFYLLTLVLILSVQNKVFAEQTATSEVELGITVPAEPTKTISPTTAIKNIEERKKLQEQKRVVMDEKKSLLEDIKLKREEAKIKFKTQRDEFKQKVTTLTDTKKQTIVSRMDTKMSSMNTNFTTKMSSVLERLTTVIDSLEHKIATAKAQGVSTVSAEAALVQAKSAVTTAQTALSTQAGKEYVIQITDEAALKNNVGTTVKLVQTDFQTTHKTVIAAKQAVLKAAQEVVKLKKTTSVEPTTIPAE